MPFSRRNAVGLVILVAAILAGAWLYRAYEEIPAQPVLNASGRTTSRSG